VGGGEGGVLNIDIYISPPEDGTFEQSAWLSRFLPAETSSGQSLIFSLPSPPGNISSNHSVTPMRQPMKKQ
jgi:hypothetical protein